MIRFTLAALLIVASPVAAQTVEVADGDWREIPRLAVKGKHRMSFTTMDKIEKVVAKGGCPAIGNKRRVTLNLPFMLQFGKSGTVERVVVRRIGCPEVESLVGGAVVTLARAGEYASTGQNRTGWYRSEIGFISTM